MRVDDGHFEILAGDVNIIKRDAGYNCQITKWETEQLSEIYKVLHPTYASLEALYEAEKRRARDARKLSSFPTISSWQPCSRQLSSSEEEMLKGGNTCVNNYRHIQLTNRRKGATWVVRGAELESEKREGYTRSSYIAINQGATPLFGRVQHFFQHSFASCQHHLALVEWFNAPQQDAKSRLWHVPPTENAGRSVVEVIKLSRPLVTAVKENKLWFLNYFV